MESEFFERGQRGGECTAELCRVTIGGESCAVLSDSEHRGAGVICPAGIYSLPAAGEERLLLRLKDGTYFILGTVLDSSELSLDSGDLCIKTGSAQLVLHADGGIEIEGEVSVSGSLTVNGGEINGA